MLTDEEFEHAIANVASVHLKPEAIDDAFKAFSIWLTDRYTPEQLAKISNPDAVRIADLWFHAHAGAYEKLARKKPSSPATTAEQDAAEVRALSARAAMKARNIKF
jgi:hypothetical protein